MLSGSHPQNYRRRVKRFWWILAGGVVLAAIGLVWTLQGMNVLGGSAMSGSPLWATIGPIVLFLGLLLIGIAIGIALAVRGRRTR